MRSEIPYDDYSQAAGEYVAEPTPGNLKAFFFRLDQAKVPDPAQVINKVAKDAGEDAVTLLSDFLLYQEDVAALRKAKPVPNPGPPPKPKRTEPEKQVEQKPELRTINGEELRAKVFAPLIFAVKELLAEGLTLLAGKSKVGKSFLALDIGIAVSTGGKCLSRCTEKGDVLFLGLEDSERRLQERINTISKTEDLSALEFLTTAPTIKNGLVPMLENWLADHAAAKLIVIDTLARVSDQKAMKDSVYLSDVMALSPLQALAQKHRLAILTITHCRKAPAEDLLDRVSGSTGITGTADSIWVLQRERRGAADATLDIVSRDFESTCLALKFDGESKRWTFCGRAEMLQQTRERQEIVDLLTANGKMGTGAIARALSRTVSSVSHLIKIMAVDGLLLQSGYGKWMIHPLPGTQETF